MILTRRGFLASCLALAAAPAIVRASSIMSHATADEYARVAVPRGPDWWTIEGGIKANVSPIVFPEFSIPGGSVEIVEVGVLDRAGALSLNLE